MNEDEDENSLTIQHIHDLGGKLGMTLNDLGPEAPDAENYEFQVHVGLAEAAAEIFERDPGRMTGWFGHCFIRCGLEMNDRMKCLLDSLDREISAARRRRAKEE